MLLKIKASLSGISCYRPLRWRFCRESGDIVGFDDPRRLRTRLPSLYVAALDYPPRGHLAHADDLFRGIKRDLAPFGPFAAPMSDDFVMLAEAAHTLLMDVTPDPTTPSPTPGRPLGAIRGLRRVAP